MRLWVCFLKTFRENVREWKILVLALVFGPFFVFMMKAYFGTSTPSYNLLVLDQDRPVSRADGASLRAGEDLRRQWTEAKYPDGKPVFKVRSVAAREEGLKLLKSRDGDMLIIIPSGFSQGIEAYRNRQAPALVPLTTLGDGSSVRFMAAAAYADFISYTEVTSAAGIELPTVVDAQGIGAGRSPTDFDLYVPALLVLAIIMVLFTAAASFIKEVDKGTITRLVMSPLRGFDILGAIGLNQVLIGTAALGLTYLSALATGYRGQGSVILFLAVGALATLSVVAVGIIVAAFLKTIFELLTVGIFPFFVLMFFSESMFPLPRLTLFNLAGHAFYVNDLLPTSLAVKAFNKILNFGSGLGALSFELAGIAVLTVVYFSLGLWLFYRRHLKLR